MSRWLKIFVWSVLVLLLAAAVAVVAGFVAENGGWALIKAPVLGPNLGEPIAWVDYEGHLGAMLVGSFFAGALVMAFLVVFPAALKHGFDRRRQHRFIDALEDELSDLRNLPATEAPYEDIDELPRERSSAKDGEDDSWAGYDDEALLMAALRDEPDGEGESEGRAGKRVQRGRP
ncbi:MAG: LapA family protein [Deltaproteobacteria bacterium]|nr:LapA family protein [Deltaproteobacteria bacterium]